MNEADQEQMTVYVRGNDLPLVSVIIPVYRPLRMLVWKVFRR